MFALILTKALPKRVFLLYFCPYSNQSPTKRAFFFSLLCPYSNQSPSKKGVFLYVCPYSKQSPTKKLVFSILALTHTKALLKGCFFSIFALILTKAAGPRSAVGNVSGYRCVSDCISRGREFEPGPVPYFRGD